MSENPSFVDKKITWAKNHPVFSWIILGAIAITAVTSFTGGIVSTVANIKGVFSKAKPEMPNINALLIIDALSSSGYNYHFEIINQGKTPVHNVAIAYNDRWVTWNNLGIVITAELSENSKMMCGGGLLTQESPFKFPGVSVYFIVRYKTEDEVDRSCLFTFYVLKQQLKIKQYDYESKDCGDKTSLGDKETILKNHSKF